jgi:hypothetical protein
MIGKEGRRDVMIHLLVSKFTPTPNPTFYFLLSTDFCARWSSDPVQLLFTPQPPTSNLIG